MPAAPPTILLWLRRGDPATVIPALASEVGAIAVHVTTETEPAGALRDATMQRKLADAGVGWVATGSPYAVTPGRLRTGAGTGYRVYGAFRRAWVDHGWPGPAPNSRATFLSAPGGLDAGYPERIIDHATERADALARYRLARRR